MRTNLNSLTHIFIRVTEIKMGTLLRIVCTIGARAIFASEKVSSRATLYIAPRATRQTTASPYYSQLVNRRGGRLMRPLVRALTWLGPHVRHLKIFNAMPDVKGVALVPCRLNSQHRMQS